MPNQVHRRAVDVLLVEGTCSASSSCLCPDLIFPFPSLGAFQHFTYFYQQRARGDGVSVLLEQFPGRHPDARFVLHEEDCLRTSR